MDQNAPDVATGAVLKPSEEVGENVPKVQGIDFNDFEGKDITVREMIKGMSRMGFQASAVSEAADIITKMVRIII
jgi:deoxyhypusine synthase